MSKVLKLQSGQATIGGEAKTIPVQRVIPLPAVLNEGAQVDVTMSTKDVEQLWDVTKSECDQLLAETKAQAEELLHAAELKAERVLEDARQQGHEAGYRQGVNSAEEACLQECQLRVSAAEQVLERAQAERHRLLKDMHLPLAAICTEAVRSILHRELALQPPQVETVVAELLQFVTESTKVEVRVHPDDYGTATDAHPVWQSAKFGEWEVIVVPDTNISAGGCEIRSDTGRVDATIETKLELLQSTLTTVMERGVADYAAALD